MNKAYMRYDLRHLFLVLFFLFVYNTSLAVQITSRLDSAILLMGKQTIVHLEITQEETQLGRIINEPLKADTITYIVDGIEFNGIVRNDTASISESRQQINKDYLIQSFDSGLYTIPSFKYVVGVDTFKSAPLTLKVIPVQIDSIYENITDYAPIETVGSKWYDIIPEQITDNLILIILVILILFGLIAIIYIKRQRAQDYKIEIMPPFDLAMLRMADLKGLNLCEKGQEKEYYTRLTDILREYLTGRFNINAMEMTTSQIIDSLNKTEVEGISQRNMSKILEMADFVKFAKVRPLPDDNVRTYQAAIEFLNETKPLPNPIAEKDIN